MSETDGKDPQDERADEAKEAPGEGQGQGQGDDEDAQSERADK